MNNGYHSNRVENNSPVFLKEYQRRVQRQEKYYFFERDKGRLVKFDDGLISDKNADVIENINKQNLRRALNCALNELNELEYQIIDEYFFSEDEKGNYTELSKKHNISRKNYTKKLYGILNKLRTLICDYYEEF